MTSATDAQPRPRQEIVAWLIDWIARELNMSAQDIDVGRSLLEYSMSSLTATILVGDLEDWLNLRLPPSLVWDFPSIDAMTDHLVDMAGRGKAELIPSTIASQSAPIVPNSAVPDARGLLEGLDQLSDEEVDKLLSQLAASERDGR